MFSQASVCPWGVGVHPLLARHTPPPADTLWPGRHPPGQTPPCQEDTPWPGRHPRPGRHPAPFRADCHCSGRYASYWNAFSSGYKVTINHSSAQQKATVHTGYKILHEQLHRRKNLKQFTILCNVVICFFWWWGGGVVGLLSFHFKMQQVSIHCFLFFANTAIVDPQREKGSSSPKPC